LQLIKAEFRGQDESVLPIGKIARSCVLQVTTLP